MKFFKCLNCGSNAVDEIILGNKISYKCYTCGRVSRQAFSLDSRLRIDLTKNGEPYHHLVGLVIRNEKKQILLSKRRIFPIAWAVIFGHVHNGEDSYSTVIRELMEETGIKLKYARLIFKKMAPNPCRTGIKKHLIRAYEIMLKSTAPLIPNNELEEIRWVDIADIKKGKYKPLSPGTKFIFKELGTINGK